MQRGVDLSTVLPDLLHERDWTQEKLGERAGIPRTDISRICNGKRVGDLRLKRIARALGMSAPALRAMAEPVASDGQSSRSHLEELAGQVADLMEAHVRLEARLAALEGRRARGSGAPKRPAAENGS